MPKVLRTKRLYIAAKELTKAYPTSAGYDLYALEDLTLKPGETRTVGIGWCIAAPSGTYARIAPKSGRSVKQRWDVKAGVVDQEYRGEVKVTLHNFGDVESSCTTEDAIAQLILEKIEDDAEVEVVDDLPKTDRGDKGHGSGDKN